MSCEDKPLRGHRRQKQGTTQWVTWEQVTGNIDLCVTRAEGMERTGKAWDTFWC